MTGQPLQLVTGLPFRRAFQCYTYGFDQLGKPIPAVYNANDILTSAVIQSKQTIATIVPIVEWYTANSTQAGYDKAQVDIVCTAAQMVLLVPTISYTLEIYRALAGDPTDPELIGRIPLTILTLAA